MSIMVLGPQSDDWAGMDPELYLTLLNMGLSPEQVTQLGDYLMEGGTIEDFLVMIREENDGDD